MNLVICGTRTFTDFEEFQIILNNMGWDFKEITIISGGARGADTLAEKFSTVHRIPFIKMPALWNQLGKGAGLIRNEQMAKKADVVVAFWDGKSKGTRDMIDRSLNKGVETHVYIIGEL